MNEKIKKYVILALSIVVLSIVFTLFWNRYAFGVWNPFSLPDRVECYNRRYYIGQLHDEIINEKLYPISHRNNLTCKDLYTLKHENNLLPLEIYLKLSNGKYQGYVLSGGN